LRDVSPFESPANGHPLFDYKVSYRRALELQARLLAKTLTGEINEYIPLMTR
jgi:CRISPR-associated protein Cas1